MQLIARVDFNVFYQLKAVIYFKKKTVDMKKNVLIKTKKKEKKKIVHLSFKEIKDIKTIINPQL